MTSLYWTTALLLLATVSTVTSADPSCPDSAARTQSLEQCLNAHLGPSKVTFTEICNFLESSTECLATAVSGCSELQHQMATPLRTMRTSLDLFNCRVQINGHVYEPPDAACNRYKSLECASDVIRAVELGTVGENTDLKQLLAGLSTLDPNQYDAKRTQICSIVNRQKTGAASQCLVEETVKCLRYGQLPIDLTAGLGFNWPVNATFLGIVTELYTGADQNASYIERYCHQGCSDTLSRTYAFASCLAPLQFSDPIAGISTLLRGIVSKYNAGTSYSQECSSLETVATCTNTHMSGCDFLELQVMGILNETSMYQASSLCGVQLDFTPLPLTGGCLNADYVQILLKAVPTNCFPMTAQSIQGLNKDTVCSKQQYEALCISQQAACCDVRNSVLEPKLHTWGMLTQMWECQIRLDSSIYGLVVKPAGDCNYATVLGCFSPLFEKVGLTNVTQLEVNDLEKILSIRDYIMGNRNQCPSKSDFMDMKSCAVNMATKCTYPSTCDSRRNVLQAKDVTPLADLLGLNEIMDICSQDCSTSDLNEDFLTECDTEKFAEYVSIVGWNQVTGEDSVEKCQHITNITACVGLKVGDCPVLERISQKSLSLAASTTVQVQEICKAELEATTTPVTTGAGNAGPLWILLTAAVLSFWMVV